MAYTIVKSDGTVLTTISDGTINTTSTSLGLPGRNFAGYGNTLDTNFVHQLENFANTAPPANPLRGQLWYDTNNSLLKVCPVDGASASSWLALTSTSSGGTTSFGAVTITGNLSAANATISGTLTAGNVSTTNLTVTANTTMANANITTANISTLNTQTISTGGATTAGTMTGTWTVNGGLTGNALIVTNGNVYAAGVRTDNYYYANGQPFTPTGTYTNTNVFDYLTGSNSVTQFNGIINPSSVTTANITTGANTTAGTITGNWSLTTGSRLLATYADLAERFAADEVYDPGTVVELGGDKEITAVQYELSEDVFGVVSDTAAYLMNAFAGDDQSHPAIAISGRVQVKVTGKVRKGQRLVSAGNGVARAAKPGEATAFNVIGRSLVDKTDDGIGAVEAIVSVTK
jgi:hypothetical protein